MSYIAAPLSTIIPFVVMALNLLLAACAAHDRHAADALEPADQARTKGQQRDNNALAEQAPRSHFVTYGWQNGTRRTMVIYKTR